MGIKPSRASTRVWIVHDLDIPTSPPTQHTARSQGYNLTSPMNNFAGNSKAAPWLYCKQYTNYGDRTEPIDDSLE